MPFAALGAHLVSAPAAPAGTWAAVATSALTATVATTVAALGGVPLAYVLARGGGRWRTAVGVIVQLPLALPPLLSGVVLLLVVGPATVLGRLTGGRLTDSLAGIVLAQTFVAAPFLVIAARSAFRQADPALADVGRTLGLGPLAVFARVLLPGAWPGIVAGLTLCWLRAFGEFGATVLLAYHPYTLPVFAFVQFSASGVAPTLLPVAGGLAVAAAVLLLGLAARPWHARGRRGPPPGALPAPAHPAGAGGTALDLTARAGGFRLEVRFTAASARVAVLGASGAGKSLTLRAVAGLAPATARQLRVGGGDLSTVAAQRRGLGYVPQQPCLLPGRTVWQQLVLAPGASDGLAAFWLERLGLAALARRWPEQLSGGQQRRVALARALARDPAALLLDEPFTGMDAALRAQWRRELRELLPATPMLLVTHDVADALALTDTLLVLEAGRVVDGGAVHAVLDRPATPGVAGLLGYGPLLAGRALPGGLIATGGLRLPVGHRLSAGTPVLWCLHPRRTALLTGRWRPDRTRDALRLDGVALGAMPTPTGAEATVRVAGCELRVRCDTAPPAGSRCRVGLRPGAVLWWPA